MKKKIIIGISSLVILIIAGLLIYYYQDDDYKVIVDDDIAILDIKENDENIEEEITVDIKGAVENPGVYKLKAGSIVQDLIDAAGGLTKYAYTKNINLSKKLTDEMVVYVYTSSEIKKLEVTTDATCKTEVINITNAGEIVTTTKSSSTELTSKVNINTASLSELTNLPGIGESKAQAIIEYRNKEKFNTIEDIKNVSGIGDSLYAKIQDYITV